MSSSQAREALALKKNRLIEEVQELERRVRVVLFLVLLNAYMTAWSNVRQIYEVETEYCGQAECTAFGTVTKGFEGFLTSKNAQVRNKGRTFRVDERVFSLSSATSQGTMEYQIQKEMEEAQQDRRGRSAYVGLGGKGK